MKIALITATNFLNIGNEFINQGVEYLIKKMFPGEVIEKFESLDTVNENGIAFNLSYKNYLDTFDLIFISCGSLISTAGFRPIRNICVLKPIKIFMGIGMFKYDKEEIDFCKQFECFNNVFIITRDYPTYNAFSNINKNIFCGIDCAFFLNDMFEKIEVNKYSVINIDHIEGNIGLHKILLEQLDKEGEAVYITENTIKRYREIPEIQKNYIYISQWYELYRLYQNASFVVTNRIHTVVACVSNSVPFRFYWGYELDTMRKSLFDRIGIIVKRNTNIRENFYKQIENEKIDFLHLLDEVKELLVK